MTSDTSDPTETTPTPPPTPTLAPGRAARPSRTRAILRDYGMLGVLLLLGAYFTFATLDTHYPTGEAAADDLAGQIAQAAPAGRLVIITSAGPENNDMAKKLSTLLAPGGAEPPVHLMGQPHEVRSALEKMLSMGQPIAAIATTRECAANWLFLRDPSVIAAAHPSFAAVKVLSPQGGRWPVFLKAENLRNIANQIVVIAIIAVGMTMVIITGGIDLSVGSLIALSAVVTTMLIRDYAGGKDASALAMTLASLGGIGVCGLVGLFSGLMNTLFKIPPFIATLAMMQIASGLAFIVTNGDSIANVPDSFAWLGTEKDFLSIPNAVLLMAVIYLLGHLLMGRTALGRYIYAAGGNPEAARLSGVPVGAIILLVYTLCGLLAGVGGVVMASQLSSGSPRYGMSYELYVIAAVVVGGASLSGGEGRIIGTLIGALIIAVISNGMNLTGVEPYMQKVVLGLVILIAVLLDSLKNRPLPRFFKGFSRPRAAG